MKRISMKVLAVALGAGLITGCATPPAPSLDEMKMLYEKLSAPGPEHARFKDAAGTWNTETKMWLEPGKPSVCTGTSRMDLVFDGRYLKEDFRCSMMDKPYAGQGLFGYDRDRKFKRPFRCTSAPSPTLCIPRSHFAHALIAHPPLPGHPKTQP